MCCARGLRHEWTSLTSRRGEPHNTRTVTRSGQRGANWSLHSDRIRSEGSREHAQAPLKRSLERQRSSHEVSRFHCVTLISFLRVLPFTSVELGSISALAADIRRCGFAMKTGRMERCDCGNSAVFFSPTLSHNLAVAVCLVGFSNRRAPSCVLSALPN